MRRRRSRTILVPIGVALAVIAPACAVFGCAGILGLDEVTAVDPNADGAGGDGTTNEGSIPEDDAATDARFDARADARDARSDATDAPADVFDAGCNQVIQTDFTSVMLPPQATETKDVLGSTIAYDTLGVGGTRAMHITTPLGGTNAGLTVNIASLRNDGAKQCSLSCSVDVKLVQRGGAAAQTYEMVMVQALGAVSTTANISHSNNSTYLSIGVGPDAPDLGALSPAVNFTRIVLDVSGAATPFTVKGTVGVTSNTKATLTLFPDTVRVGLEKVITDVDVEAVFDNLVCRSRLP